MTRAALRRLAAAAMAAAISLLALAPMALAQGGPSNPFAPLPAQPPTSTSTTPTVLAPPQTQTSGGGLTGGAAVAIGIGAAVVLGGISLFIWRDARRRAPVRTRTGAMVGGGQGSKQRTKSRKLSPAERRRRKRGKAR